MKRKISFIILLAGIVTGVIAQNSPGKRPLQPSDVYRLKSVGSPQVSPDGSWVAYTVSSVDSAKEENIFLSSRPGKGQNPVRSGYLTGGVEKP
jgi:hypothetical protein